MSGVSVGSAMFTLTWTLDTPKLLQLRVKNKQSQGGGEGKCKRGKGR